MATFYIEKEYKVKIGFLILAKNEEIARANAQTKCLDYCHKIHRILQNIPWLAKRETGMSDLKKFKIKQIDNEI